MKKSVKSKTKTKTKPSKLNTKKQLYNSSQKSQPKHKHTLLLNKNSKTIQKYNGPVIKLNSKQVEFLLLFTILINYYLVLIRANNSKRKVKHHIMKLLNDIRNNDKFIKKTTTDKELSDAFDRWYKEIKGFTNKLEHNDTIVSEILNKNINETKNTQLVTNIGSRLQTQHHGGFYFKSLEEKADKPLTGSDLTRLLDEMQQFFYNAQYTEEGKFLQDTNTVISMLRGDLNQFKGILRYRIFPKYYQAYPPFLKWGAISEAIKTQKYEDLPDYLLAYQSYLRSRDEYLVEKGLKPPSVLSQGRYTGFFNKLSNSMDQNILKFQQYRNKARGNFFPIGLPP